jgi:hypothetical protein
MAQHDKRESASGLIPGDCRRRGEEGEQDCRAGLLESAPSAIFKDCPET